MNGGSSRVLLRKRYKEKPGPEHPQDQKAPLLKSLLFLCSALTIAKAEDGPEKCVYRCWKKVSCDDNPKKKIVSTEAQNQGRIKIANTTKQGRKKITSHRSVARNVATRKAEFK